MASNSEIAQFMVDQIMAHGRVYQEHLVFDIAERFGEEYTFYNNNGNPAIKPAVLSQFRKLQAGRIEWDKADKSWSPV
mgnify:CR=1 FL=1